jgi:hypothetical protein
MAVMVVVDVIDLAPVLVRRMGVVLLMASASRTGTKAGEVSFFCVRAVSTLWVVRNFGKKMCPNVCGNPVLSG